jgi:hypothetical protein
MEYCKFLSEQNFATFRRHEKGLESVQALAKPPTFNPSKKGRKMLNQHPITPQGRETQETGISQPAPRISVGDSVRIFDGFYDQYHWHVVTEIITGAHPRIKVDAYSFYISAACVSGHRKGGRK